MSESDERARRERAYALCAQALGWAKMMLGDASARVGRGPPSAEAERFMRAADRLYQETDELLSKVVKERDK